MFANKFNFKFILVKYHKYRYERNLIRITKRKMHLSGSYRNATRIFFILIFTYFREVEAKTTLSPQKKEKKKQKLHLLICKHQKINYKVINYFQILLQILLVSTTIALLGVFLC